MGQVQNCCGTREPIANGSSFSATPISALGNQYVTFQPESPETFLVAPESWWKRSPCEIVDVTNKAWFRLETKEDQNRKKRLILNTGIQHGYVEQRGTAFHIYVAKERRVTITKETPKRSNKPCYLVYLHRPPYPEQSAGNEYGLLEPALAVFGDPTNLNFSFQDCSSIGNAAAKVQRSVRSDLRDEDPRMEVHVAANVDAALIIISSIAIAAQESERSELDSESRDSVSTLRSEDIVIRSEEVRPSQSKVPPLWKKGTTPRNPQ